MWKTKPTIKRFQRLARILEKERAAIPLKHLHEQNIRANLLEAIVSIKLVITALEEAS